MGQPTNTPALSPSNVLYYGDNLDILRRYIDEKSVDLIYLDSPFNSNADYNVLFAEDLLSGKKIDMPAAQDIRSFKQAPKAKSKKKEDAKLF